MTKPAFIYALRDPDTGSVRYIGKSIRPLERLTNHMNERKRCHRTNWLQSLKARGLRPVMEIIEQVPDGVSWQERERHHIAAALAASENLVNGTSGGDGVVDLQPEAKARMATAWVGRKHSAATKQKISAYRKTWKASAQTRARMKASQTGRKITWIAKVAASLRKLSFDDISAIRGRVADGEKVKDLANEYGVHRTTLSKINTGTYHLPYRRPA
jgi:hypothetical protein